MCNTYRSYLLNLFPSIQSNNDIFFQYIRIANFIDIQTLRITEAKGNAYFYIFVVWIRTKNILLRLKTCNKVLSQINKILLYRNMPYHFYVFCTCDLSWLNDQVLYSYGYFKDNSFEKCYFISTCVVRSFIKHSKIDMIVCWLIQIPMNWILCKIIYKKCYVLLLKCNFYYYRGASGQFVRGRFGQSTIIYDTKRC